jgi:hypothetical protein
MRRSLFLAQYGATAFRVLNDTYVTDADGTGIVHQAPAFGDDDHRVLLAHGVIAAEEMPPCPIDDGGRFTSEVTDFVGQHVKVCTLDFTSPCQSPRSRLKGRRQGDSEGPEGEGPINRTIHYQPSIPLLLEVSEFATRPLHRLYPQTQVRDTPYLPRHPRLVHSCPANC